MGVVSSAALRLVVWPRRLRRLVLGGDLRVSVDMISWPHSLQSLVLGGRGSCMAGFAAAAIVRVLLQPAHR